MRYIEVNGIVAVAVHKPSGKVALHFVDNEGEEYCLLLEPDDAEEAGVDLMVYGRAVRKRREREGGLQP